MGDAPLLRRWIISLASFLLFDARPTTICGSHSGACHEANQSSCVDPIEHAHALLRHGSGR
jgi:hypothetical protein